MSDASTSRTPDLSGKVAIVTGASRGAGKAIAARLAAHGAAVGLLARQSDALTTATEELCSAGARAIALPADVANPDEVERAVSAAVVAFGRLDILINNAGIGARGRVEELSPDDWQRVIATNLTGPFLCSRAVLPHLRQQGGGWIISISSGAGKQGYPGMSAYCASKFGLMGFAQSLAAEVTDEFIKVSVISPGTIATGFGKTPSDGGRPRPGAKYLLPDDLADAVLTLLAQSGRAWTQEMNLWPFRE